MAKKLNKKNNNINTNVSGSFVKEILAGKKRISASTITKKVVDALSNKIVATEKTRNSLEWFFNLIKMNSSVFPNNTFTEIKRKPFIGGMFLYLYDPKLREKLPYYDAFPLVIPIGLYPDGFLGLNLHYLPVYERAQLLDVLIEQYKKTKNTRTYMAVSYEILRTASKSELVEPCIHRYLTNHIVTRVVSVNHEYWEYVAFLPVQRFRKAPTTKVWSDSLKKIRSRK